jgi:hypothetical protein
MAASIGTVIYVFANTALEMINNPKSEPAIVAYLKNTTSPDDDVLVVNGYGIFNLLSDRYTKQRFFYQHPLEVYSVYYDEFFNSISASKPDVIVFVESRDTFIKQKTDAEEHNVKRYVVDIGSFCEEPSSSYVLEDNGTFFAYRLRSSSSTLP